jgi:hypothetical protein
LTSIAKHKRARCHQLLTFGPAKRAAILKTSRSHNGDGHTRVLLFEGTVLWTRRADDILNLPAVTFSEQTNVGLASRALNRALL